MCALMLLANFLTKIYCVIPLKFNCVSSTKCENLDFSYLNVALLSLIVISINGINEHKGDSVYAHHHGLMVIFFLIIYCVIILTSRTEP